MLPWVAEMAEPTVDPLKAYRDEHHLSQQDIADRLGVSRALVGLLETGKRDYTAAMAVLIEEKLGIGRERFRPDLFGRTAQPSEQVAGA